MGLDESRLNDLAAEEIPKAISGTIFVPHLDFDRTSTRALVASEPAPFDWVISGLILAGAPGSLNAAGGTGKSFLTLGQAFHIANGLDFMGLPTAQGGTLIITAEDGLSIYHQRIHAILNAHGATESQREEFGEYVHLFDYTGDLPRFDDALRAFIETKATQFEKRGSRLRLVIVDPMLYFLPPTEGAVNDNASATSTMGYLRRVTAITGAAGLGLFHVGKAADKARKTLEITAQLGAGSFGNLSRYGVNMQSLLQEEAQKLGFSSAGDHEFVLVRLCKANHSELNGQTWAFCRVAGGALVYRCLVDLDGAVDPGMSTGERILGVLVKAGGFLSLREIADAMPANARPTWKTLQNAARELLKAGLTEEGPTRADRLNGGGTAGRGSRAVTLKTYRATDAGRAELEKIENPGV